MFWSILTQKCTLFLLFGVLAKQGIPDVYVTVSEKTTEGSDILH